MPVTVDFPFAADRMDGTKPWCHIVLTPAAAQRLRGRFIDDSFRDPLDRSGEGDEDRPMRDLVGKDDTIHVTQVQLLPTGWIRAYVNYSRSNQQVAQVDLLLPSHEVVAVFSDLMVNDGLARQYGDSKAAEMSKRLDQGWQATAAAG